MSISAPHDKIVKNTSHRHSDTSGYESDGTIAAEIQLETVDQDLNNGIDMVVALEVSTNMTVREYKKVIKQIHAMEKSLKKLRIRIVRRENIFHAGVVKFSNLEKKNTSLKNKVKALKTDISKLKDEISGLRQQLVEPGNWAADKAWLESELAETEIERMILSDRNKDFVGENNTLMRQQVEQDKLTAHMSDLLNDQRKLHQSMSEIFAEQKANTLDDSFEMFGPFGPGFRE